MQNNNALIAIAAAATALAAAATALVSGGNASGSNTCAAPTPAPSDDPPSPSDEAPAPVKRRGRPPAAAAPAPSVDTEPDAQPEAPVAAEKEVGMTLEELKGKIAPAVQDGKGDDVKKLIKKHGAEKLSELDPKVHVAFCRDIDALTM